MPEKQTIQRARQAKRSGKRPTTQAGEFVREEMHHMKEGRHGPESPRQAIAVGLSKARRAGVRLPPPGPGQAKRKTRQSARSAYRLGQEEGELSESRSTAPRRRRSTTGSRTTARRSTSSRGSTTRRGTKTGSRTTAAGRTGRAKTTSRGGTSRRGSSTGRGRSSSRSKR
ncbi:hypothetical protein [Vitiosangium sp. GDMCC 1.1324]|uniref:hypothetical protein n=1 Tax=Vitiosangium sp. (strain GDMCC 1.1324) TaxID=2138576 RepID=UPI000D33F8D1|nr:hypothetical protein [Vitiosangium sp. GDMCC 1.1324]PTL83224.1 hypothetical protein DAT35_14600 [Vitiosangium sp. GDMCC 1.1324]